MPLLLQTTAMVILAHPNKYGMRIKELLIEYDRSRALAALGQKFTDAVIKDYIGYYGDNWQSLPRSQELLKDPRLQSLVDRALQRIEQADPTPNKKYTQWMARQFRGSQPGFRKMEDIESTLSDYVHKFHQLNQKKKLPSPYNDINRYRDALQFMEIIDQYDDDSETAGGKADKVYEDNSVKVIIPRDQAAACRYGRQTRWCTAAVYGTNYFDDYNRQGPLYILLPKNPKHEGEKYQLHFPSSQYMNEDDEPVTFQEIFGRFPQLLYWFKNRSDPLVTQTLNTSISLADDSVLQLVSDQLWKIVHDDFLIPRLTDAEASDSGYYEWLQEEGYVDDDGKIDWDRAPTYLEYNDNWQGIFDKSERLVHLSPENMRDTVSRFGWIEDGDNLLVWEKTLSQLLRDDTRRGKFLSRFLPEFVTKHIVIQQDGDNISVKHVTNPYDL